MPMTCSWSYYSKPATHSLLYPSPISAFYAREVCLFAATNKLKLKENKLPAVLATRHATS